MKSIIAAVLLTCFASTAQAQFNIEINPFGGERRGGYDRGYDRGYDYDRGRHRGWERRGYDRRMDRGRCDAWVGGKCLRWR